MRTPDGAPLTYGLPFDPAVINDNGVIRLYYGSSLAFDPAEIENRDATFDERLIQTQVIAFNKSEEEVRSTPGGVMGANAVELEDDMLTVRGAPRRVAPGQAEAVGTSFDGHAFFEASSIRKIGDTHYFIYSSQWQHELCYNAVLVRGMGRTVFLARCVEDSTDTPSVPSSLLRQEPHLISVIPA